MANRGRLGIGGAVRHHAHLLQTRRWRSISASHGHVRTGVRARPRLRTVLLRFWEAIETPPRNAERIPSGAEPSSCATVPGPATPRHRLPSSRPLPRLSYRVEGRLAARQWLEGSRRADPTRRCTPAESGHRHRSQRTWLWRFNDTRITGSPPCSSRTSTSAGRWRSSGEVVASNH